MVERNPLIHAELFTEFIAKNGVLINFEPSMNEKILQNQQSLAQIYKDVATVESSWNRWISGLKERKKEKLTAKKV